MKSLFTRSAAVVVVCAAVAVGAPSGAFASSARSHWTPLVHVGARGVSHAKDQGSTTPPAKKTYGQLVKQYENSLRAINYQFDQSVSSARSVFVGSMASARTSAAQVAARAMFRTAVATATSRRELALKQLGRPPHKAHSTNVRGNASH